MRNEFQIDDFVTHQIQGLENVNDSIKALHGGECLRAVIHINELHSELKLPQLKET